MQSRGSVPQTRFSSALVNRMFQKRRREFGQSLQEILIRVSHDPVVRNLMQDRASSQFILNRVEEIITSVLKDDREQFIDILLQKLQKFEAVYCNEHTSNIRALGDRLLAVTDEQKADELLHVRKIQTLVEQVRTLQAELVSLRGSKAEDSVTVSDIGLTSRNRGGYADPSAPRFFSIFATVNLSDFELKVKMIETEAKTAREMVVVMKKKMKQIFDIVKEKTIANSMIYRMRIEQLQQAEEKATTKVIELQRHLDKSIVPDVLAKHKDTVTKHKKLLQQRMDQIDQLKLDLSNCDGQVKQLVNERQRLQNLVQGLEQQRENDEQQIATLSEEKRCDKQEIRQKCEENEALTKQVDQLEDENHKATRSLSEVKGQTSELGQKVREHEARINVMTQELDVANKQVTREKLGHAATARQLQESTDRCAKLEAQLREERQKTKILSAKVGSLDPKLEQKTDELETARHELKITREENESRSKRISENDHVIQEQLKQIATLETSLDRANAKIKGNCTNIASLEQGKANDEEAISSLENRLRKAKRATERVRKELMELQVSEARQASKLESMSEESAKIREDLELSKKRNGKLEDELKSMKKTVEDMEEEGHRASYTNQQVSQQLAQKSNDNQDMKTQIKDLMKKLSDAENKIDEEIANVHEQKTQNKNLKNKVNQLIEEVQVLESVKQRNERTFAEQEQAIKQLEKKNSEADRTAKTTAAQIKQQSAKNAEQQHHIDDLNSKSNKLQNIVDGIRESIPDISAAELPRYAKVLVAGKELADALMKGLSVTDHEEAIARVGDLVTQSHVVSNLKEVTTIPNISDLPRMIKQMQDDNEALKSEKRRITRLLPGDGTIDISATIQEIMDKQARIAEQSDAAADFVSTLLSIMTGPTLTPPARLVFPMKQTIQEKLIDLVTRIKSRSESNQQQVDALLEKARKFGYDGKDIMEATDFLVTRQLEGDRQETLTMVGRELASVRNISASEKEALARDKAAAKKKIAELREALTKQIEKGNCRDEELREENEQLMRQIRQLTTDLDTERRIRDELGRLGSGLSTDMGYLRSKLSKSELKLVDFAERMSESEQRTKTILEKQRVTREVLAASAAAPRKT